MNFNGYPNLQALLNECRRSFVHSDKEPMLFGKEIWRNMHAIWNGFTPLELSRIDEDIAALRSSGTYKRGYYVTREALILTATEDKKMSLYPIRCRDILWIYSGVIRHSVNYIPTSKTYHLNIVDAYKTRIRFCMKSTTPFNKKNLMEEDLKYLMENLMVNWPGILWGYSTDREAVYRNNFSELAAIVKKKNAEGAQKEALRAQLMARLAEAQSQSEETSEEGKNAGAESPAPDTRSSNAGGENSWGTGTGSQSAPQNSWNAGSGYQSAPQNSWNSGSGYQSAPQNSWNSGSGYQSAPQNSWNSGSGYQNASQNSWSAGSGHQSAAQNSWNAGSGYQNAPQNSWNSGSGYQNAPQNSWDTGSRNQSAAQSSWNADPGFYDSTAENSGRQQANTEALVLRSPDRAYNFLIKNSEFLLGRGIDVDGRITGNPNIGRRHCMIRRGNDGKYYIRDLQSLNGTFLNGRRLAPNVDCRLNDGDEVTLCTQKFIVSIEQSKSY